MENFNFYMICVTLIFFVQDFLNITLFYHLMTPKYSFKKTALISCCALFTCSVVTNFNFSNLILRQFCYYATYLALGKLLYKDSWKRVLFAFEIVILIMTTIDWFIAFLFFQVIFPGYSSFPEGFFLLSGSFCFEILHIIIVSVFLILWRKRRKTVVSKSFYLTFLFPTSQFLLTHIIIYYAELAFIGSIIPILAIVFIFVGYVLSILADIILFQVILSNSQTEHLSNQLEVLNQQAYRELEYYRSVNEKVMQMRKIRHDFNNQLQTAYAIFLQGAPSSKQEACSFLRQLGMRVENEMAPVCYCQNMIVNVILEEKARKAKMLGISFETDVSLPEELSIEMVDLCSVFSNLLDNAIESIGFSKEIKVLSYLRSGYCMVQVINSITDKNSKVFQPQKDPEFHGYGMPILHSIAEKYHGEFITFTENGFFTANMKLRI